MPLKRPALVLLASALALQLAACSSARPEPDQGAAAPAVVRPDCVAPESEGVIVLGEVMRAGRYPASVAPTLLRAVQDAGGVTPLAAKRQVRVRRCSKTFVVNLDAVNEGEAADMPLQAGDEIHVPSADL